MGFNAHFLFDLLVYAVIVLLYVRRSKISYRAQTLILLVLGLIGCTWTVLNYGLLSPGLLTLASLGVFAPLLLGRRAGFLFLAVSSSALFLVAWAIMSGHVKFSFDVGEQAAGAPSWIITLFSFVLLVFWLVSLCGRIYEHFHQVINTLRLRANELAHSKKALEDALIQTTALQEQLLQAQKMEAVGRLAGGLAHDYNNQLVVILTEAELMSRQLSQDHPLQDPLNMILQSGRQSAELTRQLLTFSRKQKVHPRIIDIKSALLKMNRMLFKILGEDIDLQMELMEETGPILMDPTQFDQIVVNLAVNARDAMPEGGVFRVRTRNEEVNAQDGPKRISLEPGFYVTLAVSDSGVGMDKETLSKIFEPFFTTKEIDKGTGLGLATVYAIVVQGNGQIVVDSEQGSGTSFTIFFPRQNVDAESLSSTTSSPA